MCTALRSAAQRRWVVLRKPHCDWSGEIASESLAFLCSLTPCCRFDHAAVGRAISTPIRRWDATHAADSPIAWPESSPVGRQTQATGGAGVVPSRLRPVSSLCTSWSCKECAVARSCSCTVRGSAAPCSGHSSPCAQSVRTSVTSERNALHNTAALHLHTFHKDRWLGDRAARGLAFGGVLRYFRGNSMAVQPCAQ